MTIYDIYTKYTIMPQLQIHMLRVASVAKIIADNLTVDVNTKDIVKALLLHDMGNILKFDLTLYPEFTKEKGLPYWQEVKQQMRTKYGDDEHFATKTIANELHVSARVYDLLCAIGFSQAKKNLSSPDVAKKICCYADQRVTPFGIVTLAARLADGKKRFIRNKGIRDETDFTEGVESFFMIEKEIFSHVSITPDDITDAKVNEILSSSYFSTILF